MARMETYDLVNLHGNLTKLAKKDMTGSGIHVTLSGLDETFIGEFDFNGDFLPELLPGLLKSLRDTLKMRLIIAKSDVSSIEEALGKEDEAPTITYKATISG